MIERAIHRLTGIWLSDLWETKAGRWLCPRMPGRHPGIVWYSAGYEPDYHCVRCGKEHY